MVLAVVTKVTVVAGGKELGGLALGMLAAAVVAKVGMQEGMVGTVGTVAAVDAARTWHSASHVVLYQTRKATL